MRDIYDYLRRLAVSILLCPVALGAWLVLALSGFSFDGFMAFLGTLSLQYAGMSLDEQAVFRFQVYAVWAMLAFGFMFLSFVVSPPQFSYRLKKENGHWSTDVLDSHS
jgi:hypothetical protein